MKERTVFAGSILAALFASACCLGPILLVGLGATAVAVGARFEALRPYFLTLTGVLLAAGFYFVYRKPRVQCEGEVCATPNVSRWAKPALWVVTLAVALLALFPVYYGKLSPAKAALTNPGASAAATVELKIDGMFCEGCASSVRSSLADVTGVASAQVSFDEKKARVSYDPAKTSIEQLIAAVEKLGYKARKL